MNSDAGPSTSKKPRNNTTLTQLTDEEIDEFIIKTEDTDDNFTFDGNCQQLYLEPPVHFLCMPMCEIQDARDQPSKSGSTAAWTWTATGDIVHLDFTETNIFHGPQNGHPIDYFNFFFEEDFLQFICDMTNAQAVNLLLSEKTRDESRITRWKDMTVEELRIFIGLLFHMGTIQMSHVQDYWKKDRLFACPIFGQQMSRNRFIIIMRCLHFCSERDNDEPLYEIRYVIDYFNKKMASCYYPARQLTLDDSMVLWRGRLLSRQDVKNKKHKDGVKLYMLTEPDGLILRFRVDDGSEDIEVSDKDHEDDIVVQLMRDFLGKGHAIYMDNYYNSVELSTALLDNETYCTGPLRSNLRSNPKEVIREKLKMGENISRFHDGVHVGKWRDKRDVTYITTQYPNRTVSVKNNRGQVKDKPEAIAQYNHVMSGVDRRDQLLSYYPCKKNNTRWYLKVAIHIFQLLLINSFKMYNKCSGNKKKMKLYDFRLAVIDKLLPEKTNVLQMPPRENVTHTITRIKEKTSSGRIKRRHCRQCYKQRKRSDTTWQCEICEGNPGLCVECFDAFHADL